MQSPVSKMLRQKDTPRFEAIARHARNLPCRLPTSGSTSAHAPRRGVGHLKAREVCDRIEHVNVKASRRASTIIPYHPQFFHDVRF